MQEDGGSPPAAAERERPLQQEARAWMEVFILFQQSARDDRGAAFAMSMGSLRRKAEELDYKLDQARFQEAKLLDSAREEAGLPTARSSGSRAAARCSPYGRDLASTTCGKVRQQLEEERRGDVPWRAARLLDDAHAEATRRLDSEQQAEAEAEARAQAAAQRRVDAEARVEERIRREVTESQRKVLAGHGLNGRRLPLRPGFPPCGFFLRKGTCKRGKSCVWDHPEPDTNSGGHPARPGQDVCALYRRTQTCKFGALCMYDHPEPPGEEVPQDQPGMLPTAMAKVSAQQHQLQLLLHLQLLQEQDVLQDPEAMMNAWARFRMTFALSA